MGSISSSSTVTQAMISANTCSIVSSRSFFSKFTNFKKNTKFVIRASTEEVDCNVEECAPDKEVGKVSMEWLAGEKTKVVGTFPPKKKGWTGYVEKDTAGQTNIYSIEPAVYVAESAISSGNAGSSADGAENTAGLAAFLALISVAAASSILLQVGKNSPPPVQTIDYSGPSLTYYINKFKPVEAQVEPSPSVQTEVSAPEVSAPEVSAPEVSAPEVSAPEVSQAEINSENPQEPAISSETTAS